MRTLRRVNIVSEGNMWKKLPYFIVLLNILKLGSILTAELIQNVSQETFGSGIFLIPDCDVVNMTIYICVNSPSCRHHLHTVYYTLKSDLDNVGRKS